jgi:hypothetical protein
MARGIPTPHLSRIRQVLCALDVRRRKREEHIEQALPLIRPSEHTGTEPDRGAGWNKRSRKTHAHLNDRMIRRSQGTPTQVPARSQWIS